GRSPYPLGGVGLLPSQRNLLLLSIFYLGQPCGHLIRRGGIIQVGGRISAAGQNACAVRRKGNRGDVIGVALKGQQCLATDSVPDFGGLVPTTREQSTAVWGKGNAGNCGEVAFERVQQFGSGICVPQACGVIAAAGQDTPAIRR